MEQTLNAAQREVVEAGAGPLLVLAGAGTGKTRTVVHRVAHLLASGVAPERILLLTFTNKAAQEMLERVSELLGDAAQTVVGGTFHAMALRFLRELHEPAGLPSDFRIIDASDAVALMQRGLNELSDDEVAQLPSALELIRVRSHQVATLETPLSHVLERLAVEAPPELVTQALSRYTLLRHRHAVADYDDLLEGWLRLLVDHAQTSGLELMSRFEHVLVDEYQDTHRCQAQIVDRMSSVHGNLMVVGDDYQSIYGFRGADITNILRFRERHPRARVFVLEQNYRSSPEIVSLSNHIIAHNRYRFDKRLHAVRAPGMRPTLAPCSDAEGEARWVGDQIRALQRSGVPGSHIAVLYRAHHHGRLVELELARLGIEHQLRSGSRFFEQSHIKTALAFLRAALAARDVLSLRRVLETLHGVGPKTAARVEAAVLRGVALESACDLVSSTSQPGYRRTVALLEAMRSAHSAHEALSLLLDSGLLETTELGERRARDLRHLTRLAASFSSPESFLEAVTLATEAPPPEHQGQAVTLSSVHRAKGLEWPCVFVIGLAHGRFPTEHAGEDVMALEEERRLFYVACTRARDRLFLSYPVSSATSDGHIFSLEPSPFVREITARPGLLDIAAR